MTRKDKVTYMRIIQKRYLKAKRHEKGHILGEICADLQIHRKAANRLVLSDLDAKRKMRDPLYLYSNKVIWVLENLWRETDYPSSTILKASLEDYLPHLKKRYPIDPLTEDHLRSISASTIERRLIKIKKAHIIRISSTTKPNRPLYSRVPIKTSSLRITKPGHLEIDTVAHCGFNNSGLYIHTVNSVDIHTAWIARRAVMGKGSRGVKNAITQIIDEMPFTIHELDSDNGDEFLNYDLINYCDATGLQYFRSRPYKKNDQAHIEQKNSTHVRRIFGRIRFDNPLVLNLINDLYKHELMLYHNFFKPSQKLKTKSFVGSKTVRVFENIPLTPYKRVLKSMSISKATKDRLTKRFLSLDPFEIKKSIDTKITRIFHMQHTAMTHESA